MPCEVIATDEAGKPTMIACRPTTVGLRRIAYCPTCERKRRFSGRDALWYGCTWTCCGCGDSWSDGFRHERPFLRGWRKESIARAKRDWDSAMSKAEHRDWFHQELAAYMEPEASD